MAAHVSAAPRGSAGVDTNRSLLTALNVLGILLVCGVFAYLRWCKLNSLVREDPAMWLLQVSRAAHGEMPYRDFNWNYPPLAIWIMGYVLRVFGVTFAIAQTAIDILSLAVVLLSYWLCRYLLPPMLQFAAIALLIAVGATGQTKFTLFSFLTYSPALHCAVIGLLLVLIGVVRYIRTDRLLWANLVLLSAGSFVALLSKPESILAVAILLPILAMLDRRIWWVGAVCSIPALIVYVMVASVAGTDNLLAGMTGYGLASFACPWWPTGLGVFGTLASLGQAAFLMAVLSLPVREAMRARFGDRYKLLWVAAICGVVLYVSYYAYLNVDIITAGIPLGIKIRRIAPSLLWTSPVFLPVMWFSIVYWCYLLLRLIRHRERSSLEVFLMLTVPVVMSSRSLFGTTLYPYTEVSAICYPFFILVGPYLLWRFLGPAGPPATLLIASLALGYAAIRCIGAYPILLSNQPYTTLATNAGEVRLYQDDGSAAIYRYIMAHTAASDTVLDIPYGGGINFASGRPSPTFTHEFEQLRLPVRYQLQDVAGLERRPPTVIIAASMPAFGATFGWKGYMSCPCPRLVWQPDTPSWDPQYVFPVVTYIANNYTKAAQIKDKLLLVPKDGQAKPPALRVN